MTIFKQRVLKTGSIFAIFPIPLTFVIQYCRRRVFAECQRCYISVSHGYGWPLLFANVDKRDKIYKGFFIRKRRSYSGLKVKIHHSDLKALASVAKLFWHIKTVVSPL